jgi:micrococcal nuclease
MRGTFRVSGNDSNRRLLRGVSFAIACAIAGLVAAQAGESVPGPVPAEVVKIIDGDTIAVKARIWLGQDVETHVRILGIDAPELREPQCDKELKLAEAARDRLAAVVAGGRVTLKDIRSDKYGGRVLAEVDTLSGENVADLMLRSGLVRAYGGGERQPWCTKSQAER